MQLYEYERTHLEQLREHLAQCMVLLKRSGAFPLSAPGKIALYGSGVRHTIKGGIGSGEVNSRFFVTVEQGFTDAGFTITTGKWLNSYDAVVEKAKERFLEDIRVKAKAMHTSPMILGMGAVMPEPEYDLPLNGEGDTAIYVLSRNSGEGTDRRNAQGDYRLTNTEKRDILSLHEKYEKFLLVLNVGGPVDLSEVDAVEDILVLSQLGVETGAALADVVLGKKTPSGKLATTWPGVSPLPEGFHFGDINDTRYTEGIYTGYRYYDTAGIQPAFPFGFGLSYTDFEIRDAAIKNQGEQVTLQVTVENKGAYAGREVVQVYVSIPAGKLDQPYQTLAAFEKTKELAPGEGQQLDICFPVSALASYDTEKARYVLEAGDYIVRVGNSSAHTVPCGIIRLPEEITVRQVKNVCGSVDFQELILSGAREAEKGPGALPVLSVTPADIRTETISYGRNETVAPEITALSDEELVYMNIGAFDPKGGSMSVIGNQAISVAGAAGQTTVALKEKGIPALVMADGPAGVRVSKTYFRDKKGVHGIGQTIPETIAAFLPKPLMWLMNLTAAKPKKGDTICEQYATAIPIGTAVAQSFSLEFAELCGDIVGAEMARFGVHLWLAPALNIHRSVLCGRNFEYYSEDPLVSGRMAAAVTRGVQKHPGRGVVIKHYAANNQETNRYFSNSQVSERAMREIYLKGFEICVKEAQPRGVMTSYNLLNSTHTSEHAGLIGDILRSEFGFRGIVMTDWLVGVDAMKAQGSTHESARAAAIAGAGGDLIMPGGKNDYKALLQAIQSDAKVKRQVQVNATRVLQMVKELGNL